MTPSQIRAELLGQHRQLRALIAEARLIAERVRRGEAAGAELQAIVVRAGDELGRHNLREEELLRDVVPTVDAWGAARAEIMSAQHIEEHRELHGTLLTRLAATPGELAREVDALFASLLDHMRREEEAFLGEDVLRDDVIVIGFGG